jgi:hypothetical protein
MNIDKLNDRYTREFIKPKTEWSVLALLAVEALIASIEMNS